MRAAMTFLAVCAAAAWCMAADEKTGDDLMSTSSTREGRLGQLVEANVLAVHAYQIGLAKKSGKGDPSCYAPSGLSDADLEKIVAHQAALLDDDAIDILAWVDGRPSKFDPKKDLEPILASGLELSDRLPVTVFAEYLSRETKAPLVQVRAIANLYQTCLEMERDGTMLWDLMDFYIALGLPIYVGQLGLPGADADFLAVGEQLAPLTCFSPFGDDTDTAFAWQICSRKIWNWGEKYLHVRDQYTMARELLAEPDMRALIPRIRAMPAQKIAIIGHSFTMQSHWSSPGTFASVVGAVLNMTNPKVEYRQWHGGGLTASRAYRDFYSDALAWMPDRVLFAVAMRRDTDLADLKTMCAGFREAGAQVYMFDNLRDPSEDSVRNEMSGIAAETGLVVIELGKLISAAPDKDKFLCLDKIHMTEPYHRLLAREWLKFLAGARGERLEP